MEKNGTKKRTSWEYEPKGRFELKPCPICGGAARWGFVPGEGPFVFCENHGECLTFEAARKSEAEVAERWNRRTGKGNGTPVLTVREEDGKVLYTAMGLAFKWVATPEFVRRMVGKGLLRPVGGRPYRFTAEEAVRFMESKEGEEEWLDFVAR